MTRAFTNLVKPPGPTDQSQLTLLLGLGLQTNGAEPLPLWAGPRVGAPISEWARPPAAQHAHVTFPQLLGPLPLLGPRRAPRSRPRSEPSNLHPTVQVQPARSQKNSENGQRHPFCKRVPAVFQNQPAVHHKSKLITLRPSF